MNYGTALDATLFNLPSKDMREVKELSRWDASKIKKQLAGKPAPELEAMDMEGHPVELAAFKGKTVLLDFWTTWCPPCRKDAPTLDKLYSKYGDRDLMIVGFSVSEDRPIVEKFLKEHPHSFPVVLTTENDMPRPYQIGVFPTYIVIDKDGTVASAVQGDQGFGELRKLLKKAGLELD
jgi:thiol-disulfide isomerase/thioredoxin